MKMMKNELNSIKPKTKGKDFVSESKNSNYPGKSPWGGQNNSGYSTVRKTSNNNSGNYNNYNNKNQTKQTEANSTKARGLEGKF